MNGDGPAELVADADTGATIPDRAIVVGLTDRRVLVDGHGSLSGTPKGLQLTLTADQLVRVDAEQQTTTWSFVLHVADGTASVHEAPRLANDPEAVAAVVNR